MSYPDKATGAAGSTVRECSVCGEVDEWKSRAMTVSVTLDNKMYGVSKMSLNIMVNGQGSDPAVPYIPGKSRWIPSGQVASFDESSGNASITFRKNTAVDGTVFNIEFSLPDGIEAPAVAVRLSATTPNGPVQVPVTLTTAMGECGHLFDETVVLEPTCTATGLKHMVCQKCGYSTDAPIAMTSHTPSDPVEIDFESPTCMNEGYSLKAVYCTECGKEIIRYTDVVPVIDHIYVDEVVEPTCTLGGWTESTCTMCGKTLISNPTEPRGHTESEPTVDSVVEPTCVKDGYYNMVTLCEVCGAVLYRHIEDIPATGHEYEDVVVEPTCTEGGWTGRECARCGATVVDSETGPLGHSFEKYVCDGDEHWQVCDVCGIETERGEHVFDGFLSDEDSHWQVCDVCGFETGKAGHAFGTDGVCTGCGYKTAIEGDTDGDEDMDSDDAVYLLYHIFFPDEYPLGGKYADGTGWDFNGDGELDSDDAVYLLYHIFFPESYPLC